MAEIQKKIYMKGEQAVARVKNLQAIADELYRGNFSAMVNDALDKTFHLDPATGIRRGKPCKNPE